MDRNRPRDVKFGKHLWDVLHVWFWFRPSDVKLCIVVYCCLMDVKLFWKVLVTINFCGKVLVTINFFESPSDYKLFCI